MVYATLMSDTLILSADEPSKKPLSWICQEYNGVEVYRYPGEVFSKQDLAVISSKVELKEGDEILVPSLVGGFHKMLVKALTIFGANAEDDYLLANLEFAVEDGRNCWVCTGLINMRVLSKLSLGT